jgi:4-nitrophenyl phosphatase
MSDRPAGPPRLVIFDLDGVVYRGREAIAGAPELIGELHERDVAVRYATNNSMATRATYVERLAALGIRAGADELVTSTSATVAHLQAHLPEVRRVLAVGASGMLDELRAAGLEATAAADAAPDGYDGGPLPVTYEAVIAGLDQRFDYARLAVAASAIRAGARFIATNADLRFPTPAGFLPGAGSVVAAIRAAAGDVAPLVIGKPEPAMFRSIVEAADVPDEAVVVIGDNPDADIVAAHRAGLFSVLVLTGIADPAMVATLDGERRPDAVAADPFALGALLARWLS